ncbi:hypothetical protein GALMADRAFT_1358300 [Galerina marginata CBS 339.88]|uniref:Uncharacterized protein n=1 Tax=Galerina marginata (strain CBS 339.88) TaxID=685588 RepID=A0A067TMK7_GALM3|nr:hypothetical protein GALMADRAFT_1358300 [Galerina marginata CBS 339.88]
MLHSQGRLSSSAAAQPPPGSLTKGTRQEVFRVGDVESCVGLFFDGHSVHCVPLNVRRNTSDAFLVILYATSMSIYTIGLNTLLCKKMRYPSKIHHSKMNTFDHNLALGLFIGYDQWNQNTAQMERMWESARKGCALIVASIQASCSVKSRKSIDFWTCLALPASCFAWSVVFCVATVLGVTWMNSVKVPCEIDPSVASTISAVFLTVFIVGQVVQVYRGVKLLVGKC